MDSFIRGQFERTAREAVIEGLAVASNPLIVARGMARELGQPVPRNLSSAQGVLRNEVARLTPMISHIDSQQRAATPQGRVAAEDPEGAALFDRRALYFRLLDTHPDGVRARHSTLPPGIDSTCCSTILRPSAQLREAVLQRVQLQATASPMKRSVKT